jgi:regulation of enolase protein 1 (concanavalin A-like superfamily)
MLTVQVCRAHVGLLVRVLLVSFFAVSAAIAPAYARSPLPAPWASGDVGEPAISGSVSVNSEVFTISGAGADIADPRDEFHFLYQAVSGDTVLTARVDSLRGSDPFAKVGLMVRSRLTSTAAHGMVALTGSTGVAFQRRQDNRGLTINTDGNSGTLPPQWLRIVRAGTRITGYASPDGVNWIEVGSDTVALDATAYLGIAITSHETAQLATAEVSHVRVDGLPAPFEHGDIGAPTLSGSATYDNGLFTVTGAGSDIWNTQDQFHFVYQPMTGDLQITAQVRSLADTDEWAKAGVMIRESLAADSRHVSAFLTPGHGYAFQHRLETGGASQHTDAGSGAAPGWVRLTRRGSAVEAFRSSDGMMWTSTGFVDNSLGSTVYVGVAVTSHNAGTLTTATVDELSVAGTPGAGENQVPVVTMTSPTANQSFAAPATITLTAAATDPEGRLSRVDFYHGSLLLGTDASAPYAWMWSSVPAGAYTVRAVAVDEDGGQSSSGPLMVTVLEAPVARAYHVAFTASTDHDTNVTSYLFEVFVRGDDLDALSVVTSSDLGKPVPDANRDIVVDRTALLSALLPGTYVVTVTATGPGGRTPSSPVEFLR